MKSFMMNDRIESARGFVQVHAGTERRKAGPKVVALPPVLVGPALVHRVVAELAHAEKTHALVGIIVCQMPDGDNGGIHDAVHVPPWLHDLLVDIADVFSFIGQLRPGQWMGCLDRDHSPLALETAMRIYEKADKRSLGHFVVKVWRHPTERFSVQSEFTNNT